MKWLTSCYKYSEWQVGQQKFKGKENKKSALKSRPPKPVIQEQTIFLALGIAIGNFVQANLLRFAALLAQVKLVVRTGSREFGGWAGLKEIL